MDFSQTPVAAGPDEAGPQPQSNDTHHKALRINLDSRFYGTLAEVGAGQEVAGWLFRVGGASGTVAKTISAYDMQVSDEIYGSSVRYVSRNRLEQMLDHEYALLVRRLQAQRGAETAFFAFANTVSARNYHGTNIAHGWLGLRFQAQPEAIPNDLLLHVNLNDSTNLRQQQALGVVGINLLHGAFYQRQGFDDLLQGLIEGLAPGRIEVDFIECRGPAFVDIDHRLACLKLIRHGLAKAILFTPECAVIEPVTVLYKRPVLVERGSFRSARPIFGQMLDIACARLEAEYPPAGREPVSLLEISVNHMLSRVEDDGELLQRVERLRTLGHFVMISAFEENFQLSEYLVRFTKAPIRLVMGIATLVQIFQEMYYERLDGGIVEAMGRLLTRNVKIYAFTMTVERFRRRLQAFNVDMSFWQVPEHGLVSVETVNPRSHLRFLYLYLREIEAFVSLELPEGQVE